MFLRVCGQWARRTVAFLGCCILFLAIAAPASADGGSSQVQRKVIVGVPESFPPYYLLDEDGNPSGFAVAVMDEVAKRAGLLVTYRVKKNWGEIFKALRAGDIDIVPNLGITERRKEYVAYTHPLETFHISVFVRDDTHDVKSLGDLSGRSVAVVATNAAHRILKSRDDIQLRVFDNFTEALFALLSAEVDAFAFPEPVTWKLAREARVDKQIKVVGEPLKEIKRGMAVPIDKVALLAVLDRAVRDFIASPEYRSIYVAWFGKPDPYWTPVRVAWAMGSVMAVLFVLMVWWRYRASVRMIQALKDSEDRIRSIIDNSPMFISLQDTDGRFKLANQGHADLFGFDPQEVVGKRISEVLHKKVAEDSVAQERKVMETKAVVVEERPVITIKGVLDFLITKFPILDESGAIREIGTIGVDITERKQAEIARLEAESRFRAIVDASPAPITLKDGDGRYLVVNKAFGAWMKTDASKIVGRTIHDFLPEAQAVDVEEEDRRLMETGEMTVEEAIRSFPDGHERIVLISRCPIRSSDGNINGIVTMLTDFTERKQAEYALRRSEDLLNSIIENVPVGLLIKDQDHIVERANDTFLSWYGFNTDTVAGRRSDEIKDFQPAEEAAFMNAQEREVLTTGRTLTRQVNRPFIDGQIHTIDITKFPVYDQQGNITKVGSVSVDLTEQVQARKIADAALQEAEAANRAKSEFLAAMSHDLRTPLNAILGFADIISQQYFGPTSEKYKEYAEDIQTSGKHLLALVNDILDLSTIEAGKQSLVKESLSTMEIVMECERIIEDKARSHGIDLVIKVPKNLPPLYADRRASKQILLNLLSNAVKFTPLGGRITVSAKASKKNTTLKIADTGKGIPPEKLPELTDPFTRDGHDPYLAEQGWGLGLTITKSLVDLHDGTLDINSKVGEGTTVTVTFPNGAP